MVGDEAGGRRRGVGEEQHPRGRLPRGEEEGSDRAWHVASFPRRALPRSRDDATTPVDQLDVDLIL